MKLHEFNWGPGIFLISYHLALFALLPIYFVFSNISWGLIITTAVILYCSGIAISAGYHHLYSHRSYNTKPFIEIPLLIFGTLAAQSSAIEWSHDHRLHHRFVDTKKDPYSIKKGFWYAHCLWLFEKKKPINMDLVADLRKNKFLLFQHKYYAWLLLFFNIFLVLGLAFIFKDLFGAFVIGFLLRTFALHHMTWFINSLAHTIGSKPYDKEQSAVDNYFLSFLTFGEGYHNYHHTFPSDYRNGVKWYHYDTTKWFVWILSKIGFASKLVKTSPYVIKRKMVQEHKRVALENLKSKVYLKTEHLRSVILDLSEQLSQQLLHLKTMKEDYMKGKKEKISKDLLKDLKLNFKAQKKHFRKNWRLWCHLVNGII